MGKIRVYKLNAHGVGAVPEGYWANTSGDADTIERLLKGYLWDSISIRDTAVRKEMKEYLPAGKANTKGSKRQNPTVSSITAGGLN